MTVSLRYESMRLKGFMSICVGYAYANVIDELYKISYSLVWWLSLKSVDGSDSL